MYVRLITRNGRLRLARSFDLFRFFERPGISQRLVAAGLGLGEVA